MRPEYVEAVDSARWGITFWMMFIIPAATIWIAAFRQRLSKSLFVATCGICWLLIGFHAGHIQDTKKRFAVTDEEIQDFASDTWFLFGSVVALPYIFVYVTVNFLAAGSSEFLYSAIKKWRISNVDEKDVP